MNLFLQILLISKCCFDNQTKVCMQSAWEVSEIHAKTVVKKYEEKIHLERRWLRIRLWISVSQPFFHGATRKIIFHILRSPCL